MPCNEQILFELFDHSVHHFLNDDRRSHELVGVQLCYRRLLLPASNDFSLVRTISSLFTLCVCLDRLIVWKNHTLNYQVTNFLNIIVQRGEGITIATVNDCFRRKVNGYLLIQRNKELQIIVRPRSIRRKLVCPVKDKKFYLVITMPVQNVEILNN